MTEKLNNLAIYFGKIATLFAKVVWWIFWGKKRFKALISEMMILGVESLPIVSLVALFTGIILAFQTAYQLQKISSEIYIASIVALSLTRELGPVLTSLIIAGRSGSSISAEVSSMKVTEQLDALRSLATDPVDLIITLPLLVLYADLIGIIGGYIVGTTKLNISWGLYFRMSMEALAFKDIFSGLIKAFIFGGIIGLVSCFEGFSAGAGATGVGRAVIKSVVKSFILIITADCVLTALFYVLLP